MYAGRFSYTFSAGFTIMWGVSLTHPMLDLILSGDFLLHILCWLQFYLGSFCYTSCAGFNFIWGVSLTYPMLVHMYAGRFSYTFSAGFTIMWGVSLTHPMLALVLSGDFLLHILCWLQFYLGCFSYISRAGFFFWFGEFLLLILCWLSFYLGSFSYTSRAGFNFIWGVSLTHPVLASFVCGEFLLHILC